MSDYGKIIQSLRYCATDGCGTCLYDKEHGFKCATTLAMDAAAAIEDLQKGLTTLQKCYEIADTTVDEVLKQLPKRGKWELIDGAEPMRWGCSRCKYLSWETSNYCPRCGAKVEV